MNTLKAIGIAILSILALLLLVTFYYAVIAFALIAFVVLIGVVSKKLLDVQSRINQTKLQN